MNVLLRRQVAVLSLLGAASAGLDATAGTTAVHAADVARTHRGAAIVHQSYEARDPELVATFRPIDFEHVPV